MKTTQVCLAASLLSASAPAVAQMLISPEERARAALGPETVAALSEVKGSNDPLEPSIWISTRPFASKKYADDKFFRANIDKTTGNVFYQVYIQISSRNGNRFDRMTYLVGGKLRTAKVERVSFDVDCQRYGCTHYEDFVAEIPREDLDALAADASQTFWKGRLFGPSIQGVDLEILRNETAGFLEAVDRVRVLL